MILLDTNVWVDHLRDGDEAVVSLLEAGRALAHPWITGELALGHLAQRSEVLTLLDQLPQATVATSSEIRNLIDVERLGGAGIGYVDAQLLAATRLTAGAALWTRDRRLNEAAQQLGCAAVT